MKADLPIPGSSQGADIIPIQNLCLAQAEDVAIQKLCCTETLAFLPAWFEVNIFKHYVKVTVMSLFMLEMLWLIFIFPAESPVLEHKGLNRGWEWQWWKWHHLPIVRRWCRVSAVPGVQLLLVSALRLAQLHITDNQPQLGRGASSAAELQTGHLNIRDIWYWACKVGTVWWDQIGMSFAGLLGVRKCDAHPIWWKHFVSNQNVMEATLRWCYHQSWAVNIKFPNKSFILAASSRAGNEPS